MDEECLPTCISIRFTAAKNCILCFAFFGVLGFFTSFISFPHFSLWSIALLLRQIVVLYSAFSNLDASLFCNAVWSNSPHRGIVTHDALDRGGLRIPCLSTPASAKFPGFSKQVIRDALQCKKGVAPLWRLETTWRRTLGPTGMRVDNHNNWEGHWWPFYLRSARCKRSAGSEMLRGTRNLRPDAPKWPHGPRHDKADWIGLDWIGSISGWIAWNDLEPNGMRYALLQWRPLD